MSKIEDGANKIIINLSRYKNSSPINILGLLFKEPDIQKLWSEENQPLDISLREKQ